jgi:hypothetical protein
MRESVRVGGGRCVHRVEPIAKVPDAPMIRNGKSKAVHVNNPPARDRDLKLSRSL